MTRCTTSLVAAIALFFATVAPPAFACESATEAASDVVATMGGSAHSMDGGQSHCPQPANQEHDAECLATCLSMMSCSSPCFVVDSALAGVVEHESPVPAATTQQHVSRSFAPDRPPPRV